MINFDLIVCCQVQKPQAFHHQHFIATHSVRLRDKTCLQSEVTNKKPTDPKGCGFCFDLNGRGERIRTSGLYVPNVALYQAKLHPEVSSLKL